MFQFTSPVQSLFSGYRLELHTVAIRPDGCFSVLLWDGRPFAVSVEHVYEGSRVVVPSGLVLCKAATFNRGGYSTFEMVVAGHTEVKFHKGNRSADSDACVCVAESFGVLDDATAVLDSAHGFAELMQLAAGLDQFYMLVTGR